MKYSYKSFLLFTLVVLLTPVPIHSQFLGGGVGPIKPGNFWKYYFQSFWHPSQIDSAHLTISDSIVRIGEHEYYCIMENQSVVSYVGVLDSSFLINYDKNAEDSIYKYYKLNCTKGDSWSQRRFNGYVNHEVTDTFTIHVWDSYYLAKQIKITNYHIDIIHQLWTDSLGLIGEIEEAQYTATLAGCVINGRVYGDTITVTRVIWEPFTNMKYQLFQNYPNPFNPSTVIKYSISSAKHVTLIVYDILGNQIAEIVNEEKQPGTYDIEFDAAKYNLSSGIYFYQLKSGTFQESKKLLLIK